MITLNYLLKPFLGLLTVGGLGTGSYFLYKHTTSKKEEVVQEVVTPEGNGQGSAPGQGSAGAPGSITTGNGGSSGEGTGVPGANTPDTRTIPGGVPGAG